MSAPSFGGIDTILSLGADWEPQVSSGATNREIKRAGSSNGDFSAETSHNPIQSGQQSFIYIGAETAFAAALTAANCWPGQLLNDNLLITSLGIDYGPCAQGEAPLVTFNFRDGPTAAPATPFWYLSALVLPTYRAANLVIPTLLTVTAGSAECVQCQWAIGCQFGQSTNKSGNYLSGNAYQGEETISLGFVGLPTSITSTGWLISAEASALIANTSNADYPQTPYNFTRKVTRS
jgi:hypothetical protein